MTVRICATGDSMLRLCHHLKEDGANKIFLNATFPIFTEGKDKFQVTDKLRNIFIAEKLYQKEWEE